MTREGSSNTRRTKIDRRASACVFFLLSVLVNYFTASGSSTSGWRVFGMGLMLLCQRFWDFALVGLPQMLMLFLFSCAIYTLVRAVEAPVARARSTLGWLAATGCSSGCSRSRTG